jgi:hypothetical protein
MVSDEYLAGLTDGEGHISIVFRPKTGVGRTGTQCYLFVAFTMVDREAIDAIAERFGGAVYALKQESPRWKPAFRWQATGARAERFIRAVRPYLRVKVRQADIALEFREISLQGGRTTIKRAVYNASVMDRRLELREEMRRLNKRGVA